MWNLLAQLGRAQMGLDAGLAMSISAGSRLCSLAWKLPYGFISHTVPPFSLWYWGLNLGSGTC